MYLNKGPVRPSAISKLIAKACEKYGTGGHSLFLGRVREDKIDGKIVRAIDYSAYDEMVFSEAEKIKNEILSQFSDLKSVDLLHSKGIVRAGEISLVVLVSAGHRNEAIQACSRTVELIKKRLPVWKKEIFSNGTFRWKNNENPSEQD